MLKRIVVAAAAAACLVLGPSRAETLTQDEQLALTLNFKAPSFKVKRPVLVFNGTCPLSDGIVVKFNLSKVSESLAALELQPTYVGAGNGSTDIQNKRFLYDTVIEGPGKFNVQVELVDDLQERHLVAEVKKKAGNKRKWLFEYMVWNDDLVSQVAPKLTEVLALINETRDLVKKFEAASTSEVGWAQNSKVLVAEGTRFQAKLEHHELKAYFSAAVGNLYYTIRNVVNNAPYYTFGGDGKFSGARDYHAAGEKVKTFRNEDFNWENLKKYIDESPGVAGREFCLWIVKDLRRTGGQMRPDMIEAIKSQKSSPGVDFFQERLQKAGITDIDALEAEIRGAKRDAKKPADDAEKK